MSIDVKVYTKGKAVQLSKNFKSTEFDCHGSGCCKETKVDPNLVLLLQDIRDHFGKPVIINSPYRCPTHNSRIGGAKHSYHSRGQASDISVSGVTPRKVAEYAESIGIKGVGLYETNSDGHFVHIDTRTTKFYWYGQAEKPVTTHIKSTTQAPKEETTKVESTSTSGKFSVRVTISDLNMRLGPSTSYTRIGFIPKGVYTIVEQKDKWGRLESKQKYNGKSVDVWVHLDYTEKI